MGDRLHKSAGFTLVELLVVVVLTGIIGTSILNMYINSSRTYAAQLQVTDIQQNLRAGLDALTTDLRMAGYSKGSGAEVGFVAAGADASSVEFTMDLNGNGTFYNKDINIGEIDVNEHLIYDVYKSGETGLMTLARLSQNAAKNSPRTPVAQNIEAVGFAYAFDSNADGVLDSDAGGRTHWAVKAAGVNWLELDTNNDNQITIADDVDGDNILDGIDTGILMREADIRVVRIWLLGVAEHPNANVSTEQLFVVGNQVFSSADQRRRRSLVTSVNCRNMGI